MESTRSRAPHLPRLFRLTSSFAVPAILSSMLVGPVLVSPADQASAAVAGQHSSPRALARPGQPGRPVAAKPMPHAAAANAALRRARAIGRPVVVAPDTTATSLTVANPDGTFTNTISALPVRVRQHGAWVRLSARLVSVRPAAGAPSVLRPAAAEEPVTLSAGGAGPLVVLEGPGSGGGSLSLWFPGRLPAPVVSGPTATYRSVRPDIDLRLTATALGGVTQTLVVRTAAAASSPWLRRFTERYATAGGLALRSDAAGNLLAVGRNGRPVFSAAPPVVNVPPSARHLGRASAPGQPAAVGRAVVSRGHVTDLVGGRALAQPGAFPITVAVAIAPLTVSGVATRLVPVPKAGPMGSAAFPSPNQAPAPGYVEAQDVQGSGGCQDVKNWDSSTVTKLGIGFQAWSSCIGIYQSYYVFNTSGISTSWDIMHMELNLTEVQGSWDACTGVAKEPVYLHSLGASAGIGSGTEGSNVSVLGTTSGAFEISLLPADNPNVNDGCANQPADFNVTSVAGSIQANHKSWTFGVNGNDTDSTTTGQFMRMSDNPTLVTTFDESPPAPTMQQSAPAQLDSPSTADTHFGCLSGSNNPEIAWIGAASSIKLNATFTASLSGEEVEPFWKVWNASTTLVNKTFPNTTAGSFPFSFTSPVDGDEYFSLISTTVNGNGGQGGLDTGLSTAGPECSFAVDRSPPRQPTVSSPAFPPSGSTPGTTQVAPGASGTFSFSSADPVPSGCGSSNPIAAAGFSGTVTTCLASGVYEFEYSLNAPLSSGSVMPVTTTCPSGGVTSGAVAAVNPTGNPNTSASANPSATISATSCPVNVNQWGTNILYVAAVDTAGNISQSFQYEFYVPWNPGTTFVPGSIATGGGAPDLVGTDSSGNLVFFPSGTDPANGPLTASLAADTPISGDTWSNFVVTHRGSWNANANNAPDDLLALNVSAGNLYRFNNSGSATDMFEATQNVVNEFYLGCSAIPAGEGGAGSANCTNYPASWGGFTQIVAPGDVWAGAPTTPTSIIDDSTQPSLLGVASNGTLWLFQGSGGQLINPVKLGSSGWNNATVMAAGNVNGQDTIWARINVGTDAGDIFSFPLTVPSGQVPTLNASAPTTLPTPTGGTLLVNSSGAAIAVPSGSFPTVTAIGALSANPCVSGSADTSGCPGFFAQDTSGDEFFFPGQPTTTAANALTGTHQLVGNLNGISPSSGLATTDSVVSNALNLDAVGANGELEQNVYSGTWSGWQGVGGSVTGTPSPVYDAASGNQEVYVTSTNNTLMEYYWQTGGPGRGWFNLGGAIQGSPSALYDPASGNLEVYVTGIDGSLQEDYWNPSGGWTWKDLGTPSGVAAVNSPVAVSDAITGNVDVFGVDSNGNLEEIVWTPGSGWSAWKSLGAPAGVSVTGTPSPDYNVAASTNEVYVTGSDDSLYEIYTHDSVTWSSWQHIGGTITGSPNSIYDSIGGNLDVFATTPGGTLEEDSWTPGAGKGWGGWVDRGGTIAGTPQAISDEVTGNLEIYSTSGGGTGQEIAFKTNATWTGWFNLGGNLAG